jgi:hypothetical protein
MNDKPIPTAPTGIDPQLVLDAIAEQEDIESRFDQALIDTGMSGDEEFSEAGLIKLMQAMYPDEFAREFGPQ